MSFPRYPEYRDSGVEWLGEIPSHWEVNGNINYARGRFWASEHAVSSQALASSAVRDGLKDILLNHAQLYESLKAAATAR